MAATVALNRVGSSACSVDTEVQGFDGYHQEAATAPPGKNGGNNSGSNDGGSLPDLVLPPLEGTGSPIDIVLQHFYGTLEMGAEAVLSCNAHDIIICSSSAAPKKKEHPGALDLLGDNDDDDSDDDCSVKTEMPLTENETQKSEHPAEEIVESVEVIQSPMKVQSSYTDCISWKTLHDIMVHCNGDDDDESTVVLNNTAPDTISSHSSMLNSSSLLNSPRSSIFEFESYPNSPQETVDSYSSSEIAMQRNIDSIKERQDAIKVQLLERHALLASAPEDAKSECYSAISRAALLQAEVQARQAELDLKKLELESMKVDEEIMDRISLKDTLSLDDTADSTDEDTDDDDDDDQSREESIVDALSLSAKYIKSKFTQFGREKDIVRCLSS